MGELSGEFINTRPIPAPTTAAILNGREGPLSMDATASDWEGIAAQAERNAEALQRTINELRRGGGGYVYFTPGRYYIGRNAGAAGTGPAAIDWSLTRDVPDVLVPPEVTLRFAPGAVVVPMNYRHVTGRTDPSMEGRSSENELVRVEIQGAIVADMREIFSANVFPRVDNEMRPEEPWLPAGKILLTGHRIREVYPEWWAAFSAQPGRWPNRHVRSLQAAIDAAHTDRHRPARTRDGRLVRGPQGVEWVQLPTIPVIAACDYVISGPLTPYLSFPV